MTDYVLLEYGEPTSPGNRWVWDPDPMPMTDEEAAALRARLGADGPFRLVPVEYARKAGLL